MPVKRRVTKRRLDILTLNQKRHLQFGDCFFCDGDPECGAFEDAAHRHALWEQHRDTILGEWDRPERMPAAFWEFDRRWPKGAESESHAVWLLPDTTAERKALIEAYWLRWIPAVLYQTTGMNLDWSRDHALASYGVPGCFWDKHAPAVRAEYEAERDRFWTGMAVPPT